MLSGEATNTNFIGFCLSQPGLEPMIYHTLDKHANHYTTDSVQISIEAYYLIKILLHIDLSMKRFYVN